MTLFVVLIVTAVGFLLVIRVGFLVEGWLRKNYPYFVGASSLPRPEPKPKPILRLKQPAKRV